MPEKNKYSSVVCMAKKLPSTIDKHLSPQQVHMVKATKQSITYILVIFAITLAVVFADYLGLFLEMDTHMYDLCFRLRGTRNVSERIVIVAIDAKTLERYGRWPIKRRYYAEMLEKLDQAVVVGFDLLLREPSDDDRLLDAAIKRHGRVVLPEYIDTGLRLVKPLQGLSPYRFGHIHIEPGIDNTAREVYHSLYFNTVLLPSLTSSLYEMVTGQPFSRLREPGQPWADAAPDRIYQSDRRKINFHGPTGQFTQVSLADVVGNRYPHQYFRNRIVLVGLTVPGIVDEISTPFSQARNRMAGVEVHANILNNLLDNSSLRDVADWLRIVCLISVSFVLAIAFLKLNERNAALVWFSNLFAISALVWFLFAGNNLWLPPTAFQVSICLIFLAAYLYRLDSAARRLDREHETMTALLGWENHDTLQRKHLQGLFGLLSEGGINAKIQRQIRMTTKLVNLHKQLEIALMTEREALDNQVRFVEMLSHEYRTPLAIIRANLDILEMKDGVAGGAHSTNFSKMKRAMSRLVEIMDISLERRRLDDHCIKMERERIHLGPFLRSLMDESRELWAERNLVLDLDDHDNHSIDGDRSLFKTAILNLIDNAIKYSSDHEPVRVELRCSEREALIQVRNRGRVISGDDLERVFDKYFRGATSSNTRGAGLGLYLVRRIIDQLGGTVTLESDNCGNTVASVRLPTA
ncbi:MAG: CHASE2 domain-containing protein [Desulfuromonadales bacterium]|nr:CHASE2 domain-containing protein [Desulfuromonadales bacterium]